MKVAPGSIVRIEYEIRIKGGDVIESSSKSGPVDYVQGAGRMLPALEKRLEGVEAGASLEGEIPAAEASPPEEALPKKVISRSEFPPGTSLEVGSMFEAHTSGGGTVNVRILAVDDKQVTTRLLPPLSGKDLAFKVRVMRVEDPVSHKVSVVRKPPPPLPGEAIGLEVEPDDS